MDNLVALTVGIVSSLVATAIFVFISEVIRRWFLPWIADQIYKGVRLDGKWYACRYGDNEFDENRWPRFEFVLKQKSDRVFGTATIFENEKKTPDVSKVNGHIRDGYLSIIMDPIATDTIDPGSGVFRVFHSKGKLRFKGRLVHVNNDTAQIETFDEEIEYCKNDS